MGTEPQSPSHEAHSPVVTLIHLFWSVGWHMGVLNLQLPYGEIYQLSFINTNCPGKTQYPTIMTC